MPWGRCIVFSKCSVEIGRGSEHGHVPCLVSVATSTRSHGIRVLWRLRPPSSELVFCCQSAVPSITISVFPLHLIFDV